MSTLTLTIEISNLLKYSLNTQQPICYKMVYLHCPLNNAFCLRFGVRTTMSLRTIMSLSVPIYPVLRIVLQYLASIWPISIQI